jgi:preprotein translocase subunit SecE
VIAELRKVVRPTRRELVTYTTVVVIFVMIVLAYVSGLDYLFSKAVLKVFG